MSFFKASYEQAKATAQAFSGALWEDNRIVLGVETDGLCRDTPEIGTFVRDRLTEAWCERRVYMWDELSDERFFTNWPADYPMPFYEGFSYGGAVNRILALAKLASCQYLVRVDPGTAPPYYFREMVGHHTSAIESRSEVEVVSGQYTDRIALRDDFVPKDKKEDYYEFIQLHTGIDPHRQITGGAAFTMNVTAGPPPIPFPAFTPVWGSDDGLYATICGSKALVLPESRVVRTDPGQAGRHGREYPVRLASMVVLRQLLIGSTESDAVRSGCEFLEQLKNQAFYDQYSRAEAKTELTARAPDILNGWRNYSELRRRWSEIIGMVVRVAGEHCEWYIDA